MAEANVSTNQMFGVLADSIIQLQNVVSSQAIAMVNSNVHNSSWCSNSKFGGKATQYKAWIKSINKRALELKINDDFKYVLALQSSEAGVSNFVVRYVEEHDPIVWDDLLKELEKRFSILNDKEVANSKLSECKQKHNESAALFCERINALANITDKGQINTENTQTRLKAIFMKGLNDQSLVNLIKTKSPKTLQEALDAVRQFEIISESDSDYTLEKPKNEPTATPQTSAFLNTPYGSQHTQKQHVSPTQDHFDSRNIEPMEIDHSRSYLQCSFCFGRGHHIRDCKYRKRMHHESHKHVNAFTATNTYQRPNSNIQCWHCNGYGHIQRECPQNRQRYNMPRVTNYSPRYPQYHRERYNFGTRPHFGGADIQYSSNPHYGQNLQYGQNMQQGHNKRTNQYRQLNHTHEQQTGQNKPIQNMGQNNNANGQLN